MRLPLGLGLILFHGYQANAKAVFAHFMVSNALNYSQADWTSEIQLAQAAHIDAFALNMAYDEGDDAQLDHAFSAADAAGFKLFFSFDYAGNGPWPKQAVSTRLTLWGSRGSYYKYNGKVFASTFEGPGSADDWIDIKAATGCYLVPDWSSDGAKEAMGRGNGVADGLFSWAAWPWGAQDMDTYTDASYRQYLNGRPYMMAVSPWFYTNLPGFTKNWMWRGDDLWFHRWQQVLYVQPEWVQIISWNDFGESHYIGPVVDKALGAMSKGRAPLNYVQNMPHDGWRLTLPHSIDLYVRNTTTITKEGVSVWYRTQPAAACNAGDTTGNTASQLQIEFAPASIVQDRVFFTAILGSTADVSVSIGGASQAATWSDVPDGNIGLYHGSAPFNGRAGTVIVTVSRSGATVASVTGVAITSSCSGGLENWNAWVGSNTSPTSISKTSNKMDSQVCIRGTGAYNFAGLCSYGCGLGYCPIGACICQAMGAQKPKPSPAYVDGYPAAGLDENYSGLCAFDCNMGYCPGGACTTVKAPLTTPTVSPFLPPACRAGTGSGNWGGLCSYACNYGFCPMHICSCTAQGALVQTPPKTLNVTGSPVGGQKDYGLCDFACPRGYCPPGACTATNNTGSSRGTPVYIDPSIWGQPSPTVTCMPPCVIVLPPYTLPAPTIVSFKPVTTTLTEAWVAGCVFTTVVTVAWAPITTTAIPVYNLNITSSGIDSVVYTVTPSLLPSTAVTFKPPSSCIPAMTSASSSTTPIVVIFTSTRDPSSTWPIVTGQPTTVHFSSAYPPGPTCTANGGCGGSMCEHWCNSCGPVGCSGGDTYGEDDTDPGCNGCGGTSNPSGGGSSSGCVGPVCPKPHPPGTEGGGHDDPSENNPCQADVNTATGLCLNGNYPVWDPVADIVSCDFSAAEAPEYMTACQEEIDEDIADSKDDAQDSHDCCPAKRMGGVSPLESHASGAACPVNPDFPNNKPPVNKPYHSVFTCDYKLWPNVCANAKSAIERRGKSPLMTYAGPGGNLHVTNPWYGSKAGAGSAPKARNPKPDKFLGWGLAGCQVEEYPWGSGNPNRQPNMKVWDEQSVLRLIPRAENGDHGNALSNFYTAAGNKNIQNAVGLIYSVSFVNGPTGTTDKDFYLDEADPHSKDINICAKAYGVAFLLVDRVGKMNPRETSYDPWWDNRLFTKTTMIQTKKDGSTTLLVSAALPSAYCSYPSPGKKQYVNGAWVPMPGASTLPRKRGNRYYSCDNFPGYTGPAEMRRAKSRRGRRQLNELTSDEIHQLHAEGKNITISDGSIEVEDDDLSDPMEDIVISVPEMPRSPGAPPPVPKNSTMRLPGQRRSLTPRQAAAGSFLDPKAFDYLGCGNSDMDWCALPGADCPYDDGSSPEDDAEDGGGGDGGVTTSSPAGPTVTTTTQTAPTPTATWRIGIYSDKDCSGDYYSLEGHNSGGTLDNDCLVLRGGHLPQTSETGVSCRWFTKSGGAWADCDSSPLTHPLSWQVIGGICTAYDNTECKLGIGGSNAYLAQGCHNYGAGPWDDPATWLALKCSAGAQAQPKQFPNGTAIGNNTTTWSSRTIPLATLSAS